MKRNMEVVVLKMTITRHYARWSIRKWVKAVEFFKKCKGDTAFNYFKEFLQLECGFCENITQSGGKLDCRPCILNKRGFCVSGRKSGYVFWDLFTASDHNDKIRTLELAEQMLAGVIMGCLDMGIPQMAIDKWIEEELKKREEVKCSTC